MKFAFEVSFGFFRSLSPKGKITKEYIPYPYPLLTINPLEVSESDTMCQLVIPLRNVLKDMNPGSRILVQLICSSKPRQEN